MKEPEVSPAGPLDGSHIQQLILTTRDPLRLRLRKALISISRLTVVMPPSVRSKNYCSVAVQIDH